MVTYKLVNTLENPICFISYGTKKLGILGSSGVHLYKNLPLVCRPYVLLPFKIITPGIIDERTVDDISSIVWFLLVTNISPLNNLWSVGGTKIFTGSLVSSLD